MRRFRIAAALFALSVFVVGARVLPVLDTVFPEPGEVRLLGVDAWYHARHARLAAENFPRLEREDPWALYPWRQRSDSAGLYDLALATTARLAAGTGVPSEATVRRVAAWSPVVLAVLALLALFAFARQIVGVRLALLTCGLWAVFPGASLSRTLLGFSDHHAAEIALGVGVSWSLWSVLGRASPGRDDRGWWWRPDWLRAWPLAVFLLTWRGAPLFVLMAGLVVWTVLTLELARGSAATATARRVWAWALGVLLLTAIPGTAAPWLVLDPDLWPSALLACAGIGVGAVAYTQLLEATVGRGATRRQATLLGIGLGGFAALVVAFHPLAPALAAAVLAPKSELLREHDAVTVAVAWRELGPVLPLALAGIVLGALAVRRRVHPTRRLVPLILAGALVGMWWATGDYGYAAPPHLALAAVIGAALLLEGRSPAVRRGAALAIGGILLAVVATGSVRSPWVTPAERRVLSVAHAGWIEAMRWLRRQSPPVEGAHEGVVSAWDFGNFVAELGRHIPVYSRYPVSEAAAWLTAETEAEALPRLCAWCRPHHRVRYIVVDAHTVGDQFLGQARLAGRSLETYRDLAGRVRLDGRELPRWTFGPRFDRSFAAALYLRDAGDHAQTRLVYESSHRSFTAYRATLASDSVRAPAGSVVRVTHPIVGDAERRRFERLSGGAAFRDGEAGYVYDGRVAASVKIFEHVAGARLSGSSTPGDRIVAVLDLHVPTTGRELRWRREAPVDADGRFEVRVPYTTDRFDTDPDSVRARGPLRLHRVSGEGRTDGSLLGSVEVPAATVESGGSIDLGRIGVVRP